MKKTLSDYWYVPIIIAIALLIASRFDLYFVTPEITTIIIGLCPGISSSITESGGPSRAKRTAR